MTRETRLYGLFENQGGQWVRLFPAIAYKKSVAVRLFQNALLAPCLNGIDGVKIKGMRELRPIKPQVNVENLLDQIERDLG